MQVLVFAVFIVLSVEGAFGQLDDQKSGFVAPKYIERGFAPLRSYFEKDSSPAPTYQNTNYGPAPHPNSYAGNYYGQNQPTQYVFMPQPQALTAEPPQYSQQQVPDAISNYLAVVAQKYGQGQSPQDPRQGPQVFAPNQTPRQSSFQAPDHYQFLPPQEQPYQPPTQQYQPPTQQNQQGPMQFNQPEFANLQPQVYLQQQYSNNQPQYPSGEHVQYQAPDNLGQNLPPITRNPNDLAGSEVFPETNPNQNRPPPTKFVKGSNLVRGPSGYSELNDFGLDDGGFGGFGFGGFGNLGAFENTFDEYPGGALNSFKLAATKPRTSQRLTNTSGGSPPKRSNRFSRGSITGIRRPTRYIVTSN